MSSAAEALEECPWCESPIPHSKFVEIEGRIRREQEKKLNEVQLKAAAERAAAEKKAKAERDALKEKNEEQKEQLEKLKADKAAQEKTAKEATNAAVAKALATASAEAAKKQKAELAKDRETLKADYDKKFLKELAERDRMKQGLNKQILELQRKLDAKTANELGEGAEVDVYEALKAQFEEKGDKITRVPKGLSGPDIIHRVSHKGVSCGTIVIDSKNRQSWQDNYATKLHADKVAANADYAILATTVFPKGGREFLVKEGVLLVNPARVAEHVRVLRQALVKIYTAKMSNEERAEKKARLYEYINSETYRQKFAEVGNLAKNLLAVDVEEKEQHDRVWKKRGTALRRMQNAVDEVETEISSIVSGARG